MSSEFFGMEKGLTTNWHELARKGVDHRFHRFSQIYTDFIDNWDEGGMQETGVERWTKDEGRTREGRGTKEREIGNPKHDPSASLRRRIRNKFKMRMFE